MGKLFLGLYFSVFITALLFSCKTTAPVVIPTDTPSPAPVNCPESFWSALEQAESGGDPRTMYREDGIKDPLTGKVEPDRITKLPVIFSEGSYQLSYSDVLNHGADCDFKFSQDKAAFIQDVKDHMSGPKNFKVVKATRLIMNKQANRKCAERILKNQIAKGARLSQSYWSAIRRGDVQVPKACGEYK